MMNRLLTASIRKYLILTFLLFWILLSITGILIFLKAPDIVQVIFKNVCAWTSTFVVVYMFSRKTSGESLIAFLKKQFPKVSAKDFILPAIIQIIIVIIANGILLLLEGKSFIGLKYIDFTNIVPILIINLTSGPMGEELGWRGYVLNDLQKRVSPLAASVFIGLVWGIWHFPLWLIAGYKGVDLLQYGATFVLAITSFSVFMTYFYNKSKNILVAVWTHFLFNILLQVVVHDGYSIIAIVAVLYLITSAGIVIIKKDRMLKTDAAIG